MHIIEREKLIKLRFCIRILEKEEQFKPKLRRKKEVTKVTVRSTSDISKMAEQEIMALVPPQNKANKQKKKQLDSNPYMKIALGGCKCPIKNLQQHSGTTTKTENNLTERIVGGMSFAKNGLRDGQEQTSVGAPGISLAGQGYGHAQQPALWRRSQLLLLLISAAHVTAVDSLKLSQCSYTLQIYSN